MTQTISQPDYLRHENHPFGDVVFFSWKYNGFTHYADLIKVNDYDRKCFEKYHKPGCDLYRYETDTSKIGGITPIIAINKVKKLVYFWADSENETSGFEARGIKITCNPDTWEI